MVDERESRDPESGDLLRICASLNAAQADIDWHEMEGVRIPFASAELLLKTKQTVREKDEIDRLYLTRILSNPED